MWRRSACPELSRLTSLGLLISLLFAGSMWFYVEQILVPHQKQYAAQHGIPRGNLSDLYPRWLGSRELLLHGRDPYSSEITREIQAGYYGRVLDRGRTDDPKDEERFAYPVYVAFLLAPIVKLPFPLVQKVFTAALPALTVLVVLLWLRILNWRASAGTKTIIVLLTLGSFGVVQGIKLQQLTLLVAALVTAAVAALVSGMPAIAGLLIALATIKPQLALPLAGWLLLWSLADLRARWKFMVSFLISMSVLLVGSHYLLSGWLFRFADAVMQYRRYTGGAGSVLDVLLSPAVGRVLAWLIVLLVATICWRERHAAAVGENFRRTSVLVLSATVVIVPMTAPYNQIFVLPAILLMVRILPALWTAGSLYRILLIICAASVLEPFLSAVALNAFAPFTPEETLLELWAVPLYTSLAIPVVVFSMLLVSFWLDHRGNKSAPATSRPA
jgi:Glycosyltransferase family 87